VAAAAAVLLTLSLKLLDMFAANRPAPSTTASSASRWRSRCLCVQEGGGGSDGLGECWTHQGCSGAAVSAQTFFLPCTRHPPTQCPQHTAPRHTQPAHLPPSASVSTACSFGTRLPPPMSSTASTSPGLSLLRASSLVSGAWGVWKRASEGCERAVKTEVARAENREEA
jgi:hypothetical protein